MTDSPPPKPQFEVAELQDRLRSIEAGLHELDADNAPDDPVGGLRDIVAEISDLLAGLDEQEAVRTTSSVQTFGENQDEIRSLIHELRTAVESLTQVRPDDLFAELSRKVVDLNRFLRNMQPVKEKVDELIQAVGGSHGYRTSIESLERLSKRIWVLAGVVVVFAVVAVVAVFL